MGGKVKRPNDLHEATERWIAENPASYKLFSRFALELARARPGKFGIALIAERVRWEVNVKWRGEFKVNNSYRAYLARRLVKDHPELEGRFEMRMVNDGPEAFQSHDPRYR
jgi:hypothetical protein